MYENIDKPSVFWCEFRAKNASLYLQTAFWHFLLFFIKKIVFLSFSFFPYIYFLMRYQICVTRMIWLFMVYILCAV